MRVLSEVKAEAFLEEHGFPIIERVLTTNIAEAHNAARHFHHHIVLKVASDALLHKSDVNAVRLNIPKEELARTYHELQKIKIKKDGILVQRSIAGKQLLIGLKKDPTFGHVIVVGIGGIYTEILNDVSMRITPISNYDALSMLKELKGYPLLKGARGERVNIATIIHLLLHVSRLAHDYPTIKELDINPLIINENEAKIVDARIIFED